MIRSVTEKVMENRLGKIQKIYAVWVYAKDLKRSRSFYENILGLKVKFQDEGWIEFDLGDTSFGLLQRPANDSLKPQKTRIMFQVDNLESIRRELDENSVKIIQVRDKAYGRLLTFEDPNGHWLELFQPKSRGADNKQRCYGK
jgi:metallothiol transferase